MARYAGLVPQNRQEDFYQLPVLYDIIHAHGTASEFAAVERIVGRARGDGERVGALIEPACGTGRFVRLAALRGWRCVGFDQSRVMVRYASRTIGARRLDRLARVHEASMESFAGAVGGERFDAAFNLINTIRHLDTDCAMVSHLGEVRRVLRPGGVYIVGLSLTAYGCEPPVEDVWESARGRCRVRQVIGYIPPMSPAECAARRELVVSHLMVERPRGVEHIDSSYTLRTYDLSQWERVVSDAGFEIAEVCDDTGVPCEPTEPGYALFQLSPR